MEFVCFTFEQFAAPFGDDAVGRMVVRRTTQNGPAQARHTDACLLYMACMCSCDIATPQPLMSVCCVLLFSWR
jgi:hypothetical protein